MKIENPMMHNKSLRASVCSDIFWLRHCQTELTPAIAYSMLKDLLASMQLQEVGKRYKKATLISFPTDIQSAVLSAISAERGMFIYGHAGRGKTTLAAAVIRELKSQSALVYLDCCWQNAAHNGWGSEVSRRQIEQFVGAAFSEALLRGPYVLFKNAVELMDDIKKCFEIDAKMSKQELIEEYATAEVIVIDDIGMEKVSEFVRETFDLIVNRRWENELLTIFTSNLTFNELETHYADRRRIASRIAGMCDVIELVGDDQRIKNKA